jgi:hypothetical protein
VGAAIPSLLDSPVQELIGAGGEAGIDVELDVSVWTQTDDGTAGRGAWVEVAPHVGAICGVDAGWSALRLINTLTTEGHRPRDSSAGAKLVWPWCGQTRWHGADRLPTKKHCCLCKQDSGSWPRTPKDRFKGSANAVWV